MKVISTAATAWQQPATTATCMNRRHKQLATTTTPAAAAVVDAAADAKLYYQAVTVAKTFSLEASQEDIVGIPFLQESFQDWIQIQIKEAAGLCKPCI